MSETTGCRLSEFKKKNESKTQQEVRSSMYERCVDQIERSEIPTG